MNITPLALGVKHDDFSFSDCLGKFFSCKITQFFRDYVVGPIALPRAEGSDSFDLLEGMRIEQLETETGILRGISCSSFDPNKLLIFFGGNAQRCAFESNQIFLQEIANNARAKVIMYDYRGRGISDGSTPTHAELVEDGRKIMDKHADEAMVRGLSICSFGFSMGGSIATKAVENYPDATLIVNNTFTNFTDAALGFVGKLAIKISSFFCNAFAQEQTAILPKALRSAAMLILAIGDLFWRTTYLVCSILENLFTCRLYALGRDLLDLGQSLIQNIVSIAIGIISTLIPWLYNYTKEAYTYVNQQQYLQLEKEERRTLTLLLRSRFFTMIVKGILKMTGWESHDNLACYQAHTPEKRIAFYAEDDGIISDQASLGKQLGEKGHSLGPKSSHGTIAEFHHIQTLFTADA